MRATAQRTDTDRPMLQKVLPLTPKASNADERAKGERRTYWVLVTALVVALLGVLGYAAITGKLQF